MAAKYERFEYPGLRIDAEALLKDYGSTQPKEMNIA